MVCVTVCNVCGAPLRKGYVAADAGWVAHLDLEALKATQVGAFVVRQLRTSDQERRAGAFRSLFAFDPRDDIRSVTAYGTTGKAGHGVMLFVGQFDAGKLVASLARNAAYTNETYKGDAIHAWTERVPTNEAPAGALAGGVARRYGAVLPPGLAMVGESAEWVKCALDVYRGRRAPLAAGSALERLIPRQPLPFFIAGRELQSAAPGDSTGQSNGSALTGLRSAVLGAAESDGQFLADVVLVAKDEAAAAHLQMVVQGLMAMALLNQQTDQRFAAFLRAVSCTAAKEKVQLNVRWPAEDLVRLLEAKASAK